MAFFVYLFVLVVAAGSVIFGLDLTQSPLQPPSYAAPAAQTASGAPPVSLPARSQAAATTASVSVPKTSALASAKHTAELVGAASNAQASVAEAQAQPATTAAAVNTPNHCAIDACASAYRSFRAADCTYQPFGGERRLCTKTAASAASPKRVATARQSGHHASRSGDLRRAYDRTYAERDDHRESYDEPRRSWASDLFGDAFGR